MVKASYRAIVLKVILGVLVFLWTSNVSAQEITAINFNGEALGKVIPDGKVISFDNKILGSVTADSLVLDTKGKLIGGVVPQGIAIGNDAKVLGKVSSDGEVRNSSGQSVGKTLPNGLVVNEYFEVIGQVIFPGLVYDDDGKISGRITGDGAYSDLNGGQIGIVTPDGYAYRKVGKDYVLDGRLISSRMVVSTSGNFIGSVVPGGQVTDFNSEIIGYIKANEYVYDSKNTIIGRLVNTGYAFDENGEYIGLISYNGSVIKDGEVIGRIRADGYIVNNNGSIIGKTLSFASVATDMQGRYLGRLSPNGDINKDGSAIGRVGARGYVFDKSGNLKGNIVDTGPVYDYKGDQVGHAVSNGSVITLNGTNIGYMIGSTAYNLSGVAIGSTLNLPIVYDNSGIFLGVCGITPNMNYKGGTIKISPLGYVFDSKGEMVGRSLRMDSFYSAAGTIYAYLDLAGQAVKINGGDADKVIGKGLAIGSQNKAVAQSIYATAAVNYEGTPVGFPNQNNALLNKSMKQVGKILPDGSVTSSGGTNYMPKNGQAYSASIAVKFNGSFLGYINAEGSVISNEGSKIGYLVERGFVSDNNGIIIGSVIDYTGVKNEKCELLGVISQKGSVHNYRDVFVGNILGNYHVVGEGGAVLGSASRQIPVVDFSGQVIGYPDYKGMVIGIKSDNLGCIDHRGRLYDSAGEWIGGTANYDSVISFDGKVIGFALFDGSIIDDKNSISGYQQPDGNVNSNSGLPLGMIMQYKVAFDLDNKFMGYIDSQGKVLDSKRKGIGRVDFDGNIYSGGDVIGYALNDFYAYGVGGVPLGLIDVNGEVVDFNNQNLGLLDKGFIVKNNEVIARGSRDYNIRDKQRLVLGELQLDGTVVDKKGAVVGQINSDGQVKNKAGEVIAQATPLQYYRKTILKKVLSQETVPTESDDDKLLGKVMLDENGNIVGYIMPDGTIVNEKGEVVGRVDENGNIVDADGNEVGKIDDNGSIVNNNGEIIGRQIDIDTQAQTNKDIMKQLQRRWIEQDSISKTTSQSKDEKQPANKGIILSKGDQYYQSLGIALTPDGEYLGEILENNDVVNDDGEVIGYRMPDGLIVDDDGNLIGTEDLAGVDLQELTDKQNSKKDVFIPAGTFGPGGAYGTGTGPAGNLGPGGGYGPGERYDPTRKAALEAAMKERRGSISVGRISSGTRREAFDGYQKDWSEQGIGKSIVSWRVDMSEMMFSDKPIPAVIARAIDTNHPAPVTAYVERNVYAEEGRNIIIPAGSRLIGSFGSIEGPSEATSDSARVQISWERLIRPDGSIFVFGGQTADAQGRIGALGYVDQQLLKKYTLPALTTVLSSSVAYMMATAEDSSGSTENSKQQAASDARQNFLDNMQSMFDEILADKTNVKAMTYVPNGTRIIVYPNTDLWLRNFERDKEESESKMGDGNSHGLIDKDVTMTSANVTPGEKVYGPGGPTSTLKGEVAGDVVYNPDQVNISSAGSSPLVDNSPAVNKLAPPPPPTYGGNTGGYDGGTSTSSSSSSSSSSSGGNVPSLF